MGNQASTTSTRHNKSGGNRHLQAGGGPLATVAMSKYMNLSKEQLIKIRDGCAPMATNTRKSRSCSTASGCCTTNRKTVKRRFFDIAVSRAGVRMSPDWEVLSLLFTMWDFTGDDRVPYKEFIASLSPLACPDQSLSSILKFAFELVKTEGTDELNADELIAVLAALNTTASYFGDSILSSKQVYKVVDSVFDTITLISHEEDTLSYQECVQNLVREPLLKRALATARSSRTTTARTYALDAESQKTPKSGHVSGSGAYRWSDDGQHKRQRGKAPGRRSKSPTTSASGGDDDDHESEISTDVSSVMLTPLNKVPVQRSWSFSKKRLRAIDR